MKNVIKITVIGLMAGLTLGACSCATYTFYERWRAGKLIDTVAQLRPGITTEGQARYILRSYRPEAGQLFATHWDTSSNQTIKATGYGYRFANNGLSILRLSKPIELDASLYFRDGVSCA